MLGRSGFGCSFGCYDDATSDNIYGLISLMSVLMCNDAAVCGGRMDLKIVVRDLSEGWKSLESESVMMFSVPLTCWEYRYNSLLTRVHPSYQSNVSWGSSSTGPNEALCIHPRSLEISVKARIWDHFPSCWMVM